MEKKNPKELVDKIKNMLYINPFVVGIFVKGDILSQEKDEKQEKALEISILVSEERHAEEIIQKIGSVLLDEDIQLAIHSLDKINTTQGDLQQIFREGKVVYWNATVDVMAGLVLKLKPFTIFSFSLEGMAQNLKAQFNYKLYGKKQDGMLSQWEGQRIARSCFYVPQDKKFKTIRFLTNNNIKYRTIDTWM